MNSKVQIILECGVRGALEAFCNKCYENHREKRMLKADNLVLMPADSHPGYFKLLNISGLRTPHLYENNNKDGDEEVEMMVVMLLLIDK